MPENPEEQSRPPAGESQNEKPEPAGIPADERDPYAGIIAASDGNPEVAGTSPADTPQAQPAGIWREVRTWLRDLLFAAVICLALIIFVAQPFRVEKTSMEPLLHDSDRILVSKISLVLEPLRRGDIVVLWNPRNPEESWIKRIIGLPGERVQIVEGTVYIDGQPLDEPYIPEEERNPPKNYYPSRNAEWLVREYPERMEEFGLVLMEEWETSAGTPVAFRVPDGYYFVCGDHRRFSMDSRDSVFAEGEAGPGVIPLKYIYGKALFRYWPLDKFGPIPHPAYAGTARTE
jgi:signal peptidase I